MTDEPRPPAPAPAPKPVSRPPKQTLAAAKSKGAALVKKHKFVAMGAAFAVVGLLLWGLSKWTGGKKETDNRTAAGGAIAVHVLEAKADHFQDTMVAVGNIKGGSEIPLRFEMEGLISQFEHRQGDKVKKGDVIASLNQRDAYLKYRKSQLEMEQMEKLYAIGGVSLNKLEETRVQRDLAASELEKTKLVSPRDGILGDKDAEVGEFVTPAKKVGTLVNIETVMVSVGVIEKEIDRIFPGQKVVLTVDTYPNVEFTGKVENINPIVAPGSRTLGVEARLENEGGLLLPGMFARVRVTIFEQDNAIFVPNDALEKTATGQRLYVATKDNKAEARDVEVGYLSSQFALINQGLQAGDLVITQKPQDLKAGSTIKIIETQK